MKLRSITKASITLILVSLVISSCVFSRYKRHYEGDRLDREEVAVIRFENSDGGIAVQKEQIYREYPSNRAAGQLGVAVRPGTVYVTTKIARVTPRKYNLRSLTSDGKFMTTSEVVGGDLREFFEFSGSSVATEIFRVADLESPITFTPENLKNKDYEPCQPHGEACYTRAVSDETITLPISIWDLDGCTMEFEAQEGQQYHLVRSPITNAALLRVLNSEGFTEVEIERSRIVTAHPLLNPQGLIGRRSSEVVGSCCEGPACSGVAAYRDPPKE